MNPHLKRKLIFFVLSAVFFVMTMACSLTYSNGIIKPEDMWVFLVLALAVLISVAGTIYIVLDDIWTK